MKPGHLTDEALLDAFVAAFVVEETDIFGEVAGPPVVRVTESKALEPLYAVLPGTFPPLFEQLVLSYRWPVSELPTMSLLANPEGPTLDGLLAEIRRDRGLWEGLAPHDYLPFGRGRRGSYDPVCFDTHSRDQDGDCRVVQIDHEAILCRSRVREVTEIKPSFRALVWEVLG